MIRTMDGQDESDDAMLRSDEVEVVRPSEAAWRVMVCSCCVVVDLWWRSGCESCDDAIG